MDTQNNFDIQSAIANSEELEKMKNWIFQTGAYGLGAPAKQAQPLARTCISIPTSGVDGWMDIRITKPEDASGKNVYITVDVDGKAPLRFSVSKDNLLHVLSELALEKLGK